MSVPPDRRAELLTGPDPVPLLAEPPPAAALDVVLGPLVAGTFTGEVEAARELRRAYVAAVRALAEELGVLDAADDGRTALVEHLRGVPLLATLYTAPALALRQWALVGLREVLRSPVPYPRHPSIDPVAQARFERAMVVAVPDEVGLAGRIGQVLDVRGDEVDRWTRAPGGEDVPGASGAPDPQGAPLTAERSAAVPPGASARRSVAHLGRLADTFATVVRAELVAATFRNSPVPLLGGLTYEQALDAGWDVDVLIDVVRHGGGRRPVTEAGLRYLEGPAAAAVRVLAQPERRGPDATS